MRFPVKKRPKKFTVYVADSGRVLGIRSGWKRPKHYTGDTNGTSYGWEVYIFAYDKKQARALALERLGITPEYLRAYKRDYGVGKR